MTPRNSEPPPEGLSGGALLFLMAVLVVAVFAVISKASDTAHEESARRPNLLMLVREWDPSSGALIGWLPIQRAAIHLEILDKLPAPHFDLNEAVNVVWLSRPGPDSDEAQVLVSPPPRTFEGERWLPVERDANLVRIGRRLFLVRRVVFGESKWRLPARVSLVTERAESDRHGQ